jgi:hypothetical protein
MLRSQYRAGGFLPGIHEMTLCGTQYKTRQMNDSQDREKTFVSRSRLSFILHRADRDIPASGIYVCRLFFPTKMLQNLL